MFSPLLLVFLAIVGCLCIVAGLLLRPDKGTARNMRDASDALEDALARANDLVAATRMLTRELEATGSAVADQSSEHLRALKSAVADADKRIAGLADADEPAPAPEPRPAPSAPQAPDPAPQPARVDLTVDDAGSHPSPGQGRRPDRYEAIYRLADDGHTVEAIAQQMQMGKGEVQLILSLRR